MKQETSIIPQADEQKQIDEIVRLETLRSFLLTQRTPYQTTWSEIQALLDPHLTLWTSASSGYPNFDDSFLSSYPLQAADDLVAGLQTGITPENAEWHKLEPTEEELKDDPDVIDWCNTVNELFKWTFQNSNFYKIMPVVYRSGSRFLTAAFICEEDFETRARFTVFPLGSYYCANNGRGLVDTFIYDTRLKVQQIVEMFCEKLPTGQPDTSNLGNTIKRMWDDPKQRQLPLDMSWVIEPNLDYDETKAKYNSKHKKYKASYYLRVAGDNRIIQTRGFDKFPVFVFRWFANPTDAYGVDGPGRKVLGDIKEMFHATGLWNNALEKEIEPPMVAPPEIGQYGMSTVPGFLSTAPGASDNQKGIRPMYQIKPNLQAIQEKRMELKACIEKTFFADIFRMIANADKKQPETATYWMQRIQENYNVLAPVY